MKKILLPLLALIVLAGIFLFVKNKKSDEASSVVTATDFEASTHFKMVSNGTFMGTQDGGGLKILTEIEGSPVISFNKKSRIMKLVWAPVMILKVNDVLKDDYKSEFESIKVETFYAHFNDQMVMDKIYYSKHAGVRPAVQDLLLNFNKMLAHQAAWYFSPAPVGVDIWGETEISLKVSGQTTIAKMRSIQNKSMQNGTGEFEITRESDGRVSVQGSQKAIMGEDPAKSMATTVNDYFFDTVEYKKLDAQKMEVDLSVLESTPPWMVVDGKALKADSLREKLKNWDKNKLQKAVFDFKLPANATYKDLGEISGIISDMLEMDHSLAKTYYEWVKKLGPNHPLYSEILKALGTVGCPDCQDSILKITQDNRNNVSATEKSLVAIGFVANPEVASEERIREFAEDPKFKNAGMANFMLGNFASSLAEKDPERARKIDEELTGKLKKSKSKQQIQNNLGALANSGQCTDFDTILSFTKNSDPDIRKDAVIALRYCKNEKVDELYRTLFRDKGEMRLTVIQAVDMRSSAGISPDEQFDFFAKWVEASASTLDEQEMGAVVGLLKTFSRQERKYLEEFNSLKGNCSRNNICSYFK